jgi:hypothetical protein
MTAPGRQPATQMGGLGNGHHVRKSLYACSHDGFALAPLFNGSRIIGVHCLFEFRQHGALCFGSTAHAFLKARVFRTAHGLAIAPGWRKYFLLLTGLALPPVDTDIARPALRAITRIIYHKRRTPCWRLSGSSLCDAVTGDYGRQLVWDAARVGQVGMIKRWRSTGSRSSQVARGVPTLTRAAIDCCVTWCCVHARAPRMTVPLVV